MGGVILSLLSRKPSVKESRQRLRLVTKDTLITSAVLKKLANLQCLSYKRFNKDFLIFWLNNSILSKQAASLL